MCPSPTLLSLSTLPNVLAAPSQNGASAPDDKALLERIVGRFDSADKGSHARFRDRADHCYALYRNYTEFRDSINTDRRDRDRGLRDAKREWGAELFIPYCFATVETVISRMLASTPKVIVKPRRQVFEGNAPNMKLIVDSQFADLDYELILQNIARDALVLNIGVQKTYWASSPSGNKYSLRAAYGSEEAAKKGEWVAVPADRKKRDDPMIERVDPYDWFWDPFACDVDACDWIIHRTWRSTDYCRRMFDSGVWKYNDQEKAKQDLAEGPGGSSKYSEVWSQRRKIDGYPTDSSKAGIHEVWEYHDGDRVVTVLNRECIVQTGPNPAWHGEFPFQVYRPTRLPGRMVGVGEVEPIEDLQQEMNTLRSQRRDNATISLQRSYAFADGMIDPADFKIGPGIGIPTLGDPREVLFPLPIADIPNSGYQEESALMADIWRTAGIDDTANGSGAVQQTATGTQLVYQAQGARIKQKTRGLEVELVRGAGRQVMMLNQQHIREAEIREPAPPEPGQPDRRWSWRKCGPAELAGEFELDVEGGTMAPENVPQQRQDAQTMLGLVQAGQLNEQMGMRFVLHNLGIEDPDGYMKPPDPQIPAQAVQQIGQLLAQAGVDPQLFAQAQAAALQPPEGK